MPAINSVILLMAVSDSRLALGDFSALGVL